MENELGSEKEFQALLTFLYMAPVGVVQMSADGQISLINPMAANLLVPLQADGTLTNLFDAIDHSMPEVRKLVVEHDKPNGTICKSLRFAPFFRARRYAENKTYELTLLKVAPDTLMGMVTDVTEVVMREEQIRLGSAWYNALLNDQFKYGVVGLDDHGLILNWNEAMEKLTGLSAAIAIGQPCSTLFEDSLSFSNRLQDLLYDVIASGWTLQNDWCVRADGARFWASYIISVPEMDDVLHVHDVVLPDPKKSAFVLLIRDINQHANASEKMMHATSCDDLTGLLNRRVFFDKAETELNRWRRSKRPLCVLVIDADHFKSINDRFGHDVGDSVLKALSVAIKHCVRQLDIVSRIGGEEFAVLLPYTGIDDAEDLAERVRHCVANLVVEPAELDIALTISVGVAEMNDSVSDIRGLVKAADGALYRAKNAGRNQVHKAKT
jgi:diguanylate cyclase (GGDEF)-like protein/PAS domain S-box-containing protein